MTEPLGSVDLVAMANVVVGSIFDGPVDAPVCVQDKRRATVMDAVPPAYSVVINVNWAPGYPRSFPWLTVFATERFGFPVPRPRLGDRDDIRTFLTPPKTVSTEGELLSWLMDVLPAAVAQHAPRAAAARNSADVSTWPVEAADAVRKLGWWCSSS